MAHVVTSKCVGCKFTDCVTVCPVACFYEVENQLLIHPKLQLGDYVALPDTNRFNGFPLPQLTRLKEDLETVKTVECRLNPRENEKLIA